MRTWNSPIINLVHSLCFLANLVAGLFDISRHNHYWIWNFICAGFIVGVNVAMALAKRRLERARLAVMGQYYLGQARSKGMTDTEIQEAWLMAIRNLECVAKNTGATLIDNARAEIIIDRYKYIIIPHGIERVGVPPYVAYGRSTCLRQHPAPYPELIASTLLLLKNDPTIFERWAAQDGWYA